MLVSRSFTAQEIDMKIAMAALALAVLSIPDALAQTSATAAAGAEPSFRARLFQRYCDKLREGPAPYVAFVRRLSTVYAYRVEDFAPRDPGDEVVAVCRDLNAFVAQAAVTTKR
jgi:hypothetical protein